MMPPVSGAARGGPYGHPFPDRAMRVTAIFILTVVLSGCISGFSCPETPFVFAQRPSDYYGPGQFFSRCPGDGEPIRCYHYHRHWICERGDTLYWDRNLESAARSACGCPPLPGTRPAAPAQSGNPDRRVF